jgi:hypothetical protein
VLGLRGPVQGERLLEPLDGEARVPAPVGRLPEALQGARPQGVRLGALEELGVEPFDLVQVSQAEDDLGLEEGPSDVAAAVLRARGEPVLGDAEPAPELAQKLERGDAVPGLDPRDVGRRAAREREPALAEPGFLARAAKPPADGARVVDVR